MSRKGLKASQRAHARLERYHAHKVSNAASTRTRDVHMVKRNYHSVCQAIQTRLGRRMTQAEKKKAYNDTVCSFF